MVSGAFKLPGKRAVHSAEGAELPFGVVDTTETPVERPKKSGGSAKAVRKNDTR